MVCGLNSASGKKAVREGLGGWVMQDLEEELLQYNLGIWLLWAFLENLFIYPFGLPPPVIISYHVPVRFVFFKILPSLSDSALPPPPRQSSMRSDES